MGGNDQPSPTSLQATSARARPSRQEDTGARRRVRFLTHGVRIASQRDRRIRNGTGFEPVGHYKRDPCSYHSTEHHGDPFGSLVGIDLGPTTRQLVTRPASLRRCSGPVSYEAAKSAAHADLRRLHHHISPTKPEPNCSQVAGSGTGEATKPWVPVALSKSPTIWPASLIPNAIVVPVEPGTSMVVKVAPSLRKPCLPVASLKNPTIRPASLIPNASVPVEPGISIVVKVAPSFRKPWSRVAS